MKELGHEYLKKKRRPKKFWVLLFVLFFIIFIVFSLYAILVNPVLNKTLEFKAVQLATSSMNEAVKSVIQNNAAYNNMVVITYNNDGDINLIQAKSYEINKVSQDVAIKTEETIEQKGAKGVGIPLGTFLGISVFSGLGPNIDIKVKPIDSVYCSFVSKFESTGINQTLHRIYITIHASVGVVVPFYQKSFIAEQTILACENVIVGKVPEVYLYSDNMDTLLNFVPY